MKAVPPKPRTEQEQLRLIKVRVPISLFEKINDLRGAITLSSWCRDLLARRIMPDPSLAATQQVVRTTARLTKLIFDLDAMIDHREQYSQDEMRILGSLITLEREVRALREDCKQLVNVVALEQLNRAGVLEKTSDR